MQVVGSGWGGRPGDLDVYPRGDNRKGAIAEEARGTGGPRYILRRNHFEVLHQAFNEACDGVRREEPHELR